MKRAAKDVKVISCNPSKCGKCQICKRSQCWKCNAETCANWGNRDCRVILKEQWQDMEYRTRLKVVG